MHLDASIASDLIIFASFLLKDEIYISNKVTKIFAHTREVLNTDQKKSILSMMEKVGKIDGILNNEQKELLNAVAETFNIKYGID